MQDLARFSSLRWRFFMLIGFLLLGRPVAMSAQISRADSASVVLDVATGFERRGELDIARRLLSYIVNQFAGTPAADSAAERLGRIGRANPVETGRTGYVLFNTLYGAFLGVAIPAAFGSNEGAPYGAGLLIGTPLGFFGSRAYSKNHIRTAGQAGIASFATLWGTWNGLIVQQVFDIGDEDVCDGFTCYPNTSDTAPWAAMVIGGLGGIAAGYAIISATEVANGTSTLVSHSGFWGTWFGLTLGRASDLTDDDLWTSILIAGNAGVLAALPASRAWQPSSSRVRLITAAGVAGGLTGFGIDLLANVDDVRNVLGIAAGGSALGLLIGALATRGHEDLDLGSGPPRPNAVLGIRQGLTLGIPMPEPGSVRLWRSLGRTRTVPAARVNLLSWSFRGHPEARPNDR